jgi:hypothetical protein
MARPTIRRQLMAPVITRRRLIKRRPLMAPVIIPQRRLIEAAGGDCTSRYRSYNPANRHVSRQKTAYALPARDRTNIEHRGPPLAALWCGSFQHASGLALRKLINSRPYLAARINK